jgi:hypothetical protein
MTSPDDICRTCGQTRAWHEGEAPRHQFNADAQSLANGSSEVPRKREDAPKITLDDAIKRVRRQSDPVLRLLLVGKGLLTADEIIAAEYRVAEKLAAGEVYTEVNSGASQGDKQNLHPNGGDHSSDPRVWAGGEAVRGLRGDSSEPERGARQLGPQDDQPSGQPYEQLSFGPGDDPAAFGGSDTGGRPTEGVGGRDSLAHSPFGLGRP